MPVGVPKVVFQIPGDDEDSWVDLYHRLFHERLLFLGEEVESEIANQLVGLMVYLSLVDKTRDLYMFINSPGGEVLSGLAIYDAMQFVEAEVQTVGVGLAASMGSLILLGGTKTKRLAFPHARVMIHQPATSFFEEKTGECMVEASELMIIHQTMIEIYCERTGKPSWQISKDLQRDSFMSAEEAVAYGIVDAVTELF
uniref:ATP-dependent Clp protease proteolytic subunit n=1 Tax=Lens culinaris TaxID=3864 RepID=A0A023INB8_LENCU|nr:clp protease proteolytic subunit [Lens culinaris]AGW45920.1 clp protease proteolytic subunit [Lens culinaris]AIL56080.1 clp protease proteolytic subunit [Lens culinaris]